MSVIVMALFAPLRRLFANRPDPAQQAAAAGLDGGRRDSLLGTDAFGRDI
jgi:ABC-type dipeptide/oligopeptide/nickel transport system permease subunit